MRIYCLPLAPGTGPFALLLILGFLIPAGARAQNPLAASNPSPAPYAGTFIGDKLAVVLKASGDGAYSGELRLGGKTYPATAHTAGDGIAGSFQAGGKDYPFTSKLENYTLILMSGNTRYEMRKAVAAPVDANPLDQAAPAPGGPTSRGSEDAPLAAGELPAAFSELGVTESGRSLFAKFPELNSVDALIQHIGDGLGKVFDAKPHFANAFVDSKAKGKGVAAFTAKLKGSGVKGMVMFGIDPQAGASATIIYSRPDATEADMDVLMATLPARAKMQTVQFPDSSGSIDVPEGWTPKMQSLTAGPWVVAGPKGQIIFWNSKIIVDTPESFRVKTAHQAYDSSIRVWELGGRRGPGPMPLEQRLAYLTISPFLSPEDAFKSVLPGVNDKARAAGRAWIEYGKVSATQKAEANPLIQGSKAAVFALQSVVHMGDKPGQPCREMMRIDTLPNGQTWAMVLNQCIAPESSFDRDLPTMMDIVNSAKLSDGAMQRQMDKDNQVFQAIMAQSAADHEALMQRGREFNANQEERFRQNQRLVQAQAKARHDANSNMQEMALGLRDVYDSATGQMHRVDLYNASGIVDSLNAASNDPGRFIQVPLRYER